MAPQRSRSRLVLQGRRGIGYRVPSHHRGNDIYAANGVDEKINILLRSSLEVLTSFGDGGRGPGQFFGVHNLATDSKGNLYATETYTGARVQRFVYKGVGPVTKAEQGVVRPRAR